MSIKTTIPISEARKRLFEISKQVHGGINFTITENGKPTMMFVSPEEIESWKETVETLQDIPNLDKLLREAEEDRRKGRLIPLEDVIKDLEKRKAKNVPRRTHSKRKKRIIIH